MDPLDEWLRAGHDEMAARLVEAGAQDGGEGASRLVEAAFRGTVRAARAMIVAGFALDGRATLDPALRRRGERALTHLEPMGQGVFDLLAKASKIFDQADDMSEEEAVAVAASLGGQLEQLRARREASKGRETEEERDAPTWIYDNAPAVVVAAGEGQRAILELLATAGADLSLADDQGITPWAAADRAGHHELAAWIEAVGGARQASLTRGEAHPSRMR